jgi:hypothetical protein
MSTSSKIILKKSSVSEKIPQTGDLDFGELAINFADGRLYFRDSSDQIQFFEKVTDEVGEDFNVLLNDLDFGSVTDSVTNILDLESVDGTITGTFDNGFLALSGIVTPNLFILPSVSITELTDGQEGQVIYVPDADGGPTLAFFDGTIWKRATDNQALV